MQGVFKVFIHVATAGCRAVMDPHPKPRSEVFSPFEYPVVQWSFFSNEYTRDEQSFLDVVFNRRSEVGTNTVPRDILSRLLSLSTRISASIIDGQGYVVTKRTAPSAGGRHPIDLLVLAVDGEDRPTVSYFNPVSNAIGRLNVDSSHVMRFYDAIGSTIPLDKASVIWFSIQASKTEVKYEYAQSLIWRDVGALLYCIQLMATFLGCKSCPVGTLASDEFKGLFNSSLVTSGGGIVITM